MERWNGWGDDRVTYGITEAAEAKLREWVGPATPPSDASLASVSASVPPSRLPMHPLVDSGARARVCHARGQSLPDWLALRSGQIGCFPDGVAFPTGDEDVRALLAYAQETGASVIPYGGGTSVVGHINPVPGSRPVLTVNMSRMNRLRQFNDHSLQATFGAGVAGPDLEAQLRARGCTLGHFPQSFEYSTLGGWVATRSSGQQSLGYGRIDELFVGGKVESPAGTLRLPVTFPASAAGPDLRQLVLGSEGRLGLISEVTVRATPLPEREQFHAVFFPDFDHGREAAREMVQAGIPLSLLRLSTARETETTLAMAGHELLLGALERLLSLRGAGPEKAMMLLGASGRAQLVRSARKEALAIAANHGGVHVGRTFGNEWHEGRFRTPYLRNTLWEKGYAIDTLETAITWEQVPTMIGAVEAALTTGLVGENERVYAFTHLSHFYKDGCSVYTTYIFRLAADPAVNLSRWRQLKQAASEAIVKGGGTISHQHGVGLDHAPYLEAEKGKVGIAFLRDALDYFDPGGIMNPGKLIP